MGTTAKATHREPWIKGKFVEQKAPFKLKDIWALRVRFQMENRVPSRIHESPHLGTRQYARILEGWVEELGLGPADYGTHSMRRIKATLIYRRTRNLRAVQLLLGHSPWWCSASSSGSNREASSQ